MAAIDFPNSPAVNDIHTVGSKSWQWDGITWNLLSTTVVNTLTGTANQVLVAGTSGTAQSGALTLTLPQDIATTSTPTFNGILTPNVTNVGIQNVAGTSYLHVDRTTGNSQWVTKNTGQAYIDAETINLRSSGGTSRLTIGTTVSTPLQIVSSLATGTSPLSVTSTTVNTNLNADLLDGIHSTGFARHFSSGQIIAHGSFTSAAFSGANPSTASGTFNFGVTFGATPILLLSCTALTSNTSTFINVGTTLSTTQGSYRAALGSGSSTSTVTIYWVAIGSA